MFGVAGADVVDCVIFDWFWWDGWFGVVFDLFMEGVGMGVIVLFYV